MKKALSLVLAIVLLCGCLFTLASCSMPLSGKYKNGLTTYEFDGKEFTRTTSLGGLSYTAGGTYEITKEGDVEYITFTYGEDGDENAKEEDGVKLELVRGTEGDTKYLKIGYLKYEKVD